MSKIIGAVYNSIKVEPKKVEEIKENKEVKEVAEEIKAPKKASRK